MLRLWELSGKGLVLEQVSGNFEVGRCSEDFGMRGIRDLRQLMIDNDCNDNLSKRVEEVVASYLRTTRAIVL